MPTLDIVWYEAELATEQERNRQPETEGWARATLASLLFRPRNEPCDPCKPLAMAIATSGC